jgi:hypothetical protein
VYLVIETRLCAESSIKTKTPLASNPPKMKRSFLQVFHHLHELTLPLPWLGALWLALRAMLSSANRIEHFTSFCNKTVLQIVSSEMLAFKFQRSEKSTNLLEARFLFAALLGGGWSRRRPRTIVQ